MEQQLEQIREQQRQSWNKASAGWEKWNDLNMAFMKPIGDEIIRLLRPANGDVVLDVGSGTGEPGLSIADQLQGGHVILTDLAEDMVKVARENAARRGIKNIETRACDACELPFADNTFDAISCRFGILYCPDMRLAAKEMFRVLKPGGRIATAVWNVAEKNFWVTAITGVINKEMELPAPTPGSPGMFRGAEDGFMTGLLSEAGFKNVVQSEIAGKLNAGTFEVYWNMMDDMATPVEAGLRNANEAMRAKIKVEVAQAVKQKYPEEYLRIDSSALVIYGEK